MVATNDSITQTEGSEVGDDLLKPFDLLLDPKTESAQRSAKRRRSDWRHQVIVALQCVLGVSSHHNHHHHHHHHNHNDHHRGVASVNRSDQDSSSFDHLTRAEDYEHDDSQRPSRRRRSFLYAGLLAIGVGSIYSLRRPLRQRMRLLIPVILAALRRPDYAGAKEVPISWLRDAALVGVVKRALVDSTTIIFQVHGKWKRSALPPNSPSIQADLMDALSRGGCPDIAALPQSLSSKASAALLVALPFVYLAFAYRMLKNMHGGEDILSNVTPHRRQQTTFRDVAGLPNVIPELYEIVSYLENPQHYQQLGATPPRGVLLHGPPGTGKTLLAKAVAGEANCDAFLVCSGSDFCEMYVGRGSARVRAVFRKARNDAYRNRFGVWHSLLSWMAPVSTKPATAIIFIDELDALAKSRSIDSMNSNDERDQTLNQLLTEMDGFQTTSKAVTVIVIAASNRADVLDPAILRRFDRQIHVGYPDADGRRDIFKVQTRSINCAPNIEWDRLASKDLTDAFSGGDIRTVVNDAALLATRQRSGQVSQPHLELAIQRLRDAKQAVRRPSPLFLIPPPNR